MSAAPGSSTERRKEERLSARDRAFVQIVQADDPTLVAKTFACEVVEVSPGGIRIRSDVLIADGSKLDLWIDVDSHPGKMFLTCEVQWVSWEDNDEFHVGVQMLDSPATDIARWRELYR